MLYKRAKRNNSEVAWQQFKEFSNKVETKIRKNDKNFDISVNAKYNHKKIMSVASQRKCSENTSFTVNDTVISNSFDIADAFNKHFASKFDGMYMYNPCES